MALRILAIVSVTLAATFVAAPRPAAPQATGGPSEFVRALAQGGVIGVLEDDDSVSVVEGQVPERWAALLPVPPAGRVLGTVFGPTAAMAFVVVRGTPAAAATLVEAAALQKGWVAQRIPTTPSRPFVPQVEAGGPRQYCRGAREQLVAAPRAAGSESVVQLIYLSRADVPCGGGDPESPFTKVLPPLEAPPLPEGARPMDCGNIGRRSTGTAVGIASDATPAAILADYARQLEAAGWQRADASGPSAVGTWSKPGATGGTSQVQLMVSPMSGTRRTCRSVSITLEQRP